MFSRHRVLFWFFTCARETTRESVGKGSFMAGQQMPVQFNPQQQQQQLHPQIRQSPQDKLQLILRVRFSLSSSSFLPRLPPQRVRDLKQAGHTPESSQELRNLLTYLAAFQSQQQQAQQQQHHHQLSASLFPLSASSPHPPQTAHIHTHSRPFRTAMSPIPHPTPPRPLSHPAQHPRMRLHPSPPVLSPPRLFPRPRPSPLPRTR